VLGHGQQRIEQAVHLTANPLKTASEQIIGEHEPHLCVVPSARVERHGAGRSAARTLDDLLDARLRSIEARLAMPAQRFTALVESDRFFQRHVTALELANDVFERAKRFFEAHAIDRLGLSFHRGGLAGLPVAVNSARRTSIGVHHSRMTSCEESPPWLRRVPCPRSPHKSSSSTASAPKNTSAFSRRSDANRTWSSSASSPSCGASTARTRVRAST